MALEFLIGIRNIYWSDKKEHNNSMRFRMIYLNLLFLRIIDRIKISY